MRAATRWMTGLLAAALGLAASGAQAHTWYVQSTQYRLTRPGGVNLFMGWGHRLPLDDPVRGEKMKSLKVRTPEAETRSLKVAPGRGFHCTQLTLDSAGTYTVFGESNPGYYTIYRDKQNRVHHHVGPTDEINDAKQIIFSVLAHQYPKAIITLGPEAKGETPAAVGQKLEIIPDSDPAGLKVGDRFSFRVLFDGKPLATGGEFSATYLGYSTAAEDPLYRGREVKEGAGGFDLAKAGVWYVAVEYMSPAPPALASKCRKMLYTASLAFEVPSGRKAPPPPH